jgi:hypothetical protein
MSNAQDLQELEITIAEAKKKIARKDALVRLQKNQDFVDLIEKGFMEAHAIRQVMLKSHPGLQGENQQKMLDMQITAIGSFKQYLIAITTDGNNAEAALTVDEQTQEELLAEDVANVD